MKIKILNAVGVEKFTSMKRARRMVRQGSAEAVSACCIRMIDANHKHKSAIASDEAARCVQYDIATVTGMLTQRQAQGLPFAGNVARLGLPA